MVYIDGKLWGGVALALMVWGLLVYIFTFLNYTAGLIQYFATSVLALSPTITVEMAYSMGQFCTLLLYGLILLVIFVLIATALGVFRKRGR